MHYTITTSQNFKPVSWPGGTTTELFIYPLTADYHKRNFQFRLSKASVETDRSDFTTLPGIARKLMVLSGKTTLSHEGHYSRQLNKFEVDEFKGDWKTSSVGKCTDFNLMTIGKTTGELSAIVIEKDQHVKYSIKENCDWLFIFNHSGIVRIDLDSQIKTINTGDLLIINNITTRNLKIYGIEKSELVYAEITL